MTIASETRRNDYTLNGATVVYPYTFRTLAAVDLQVVTRSAATGVETILNYPADFDVSGVGNAVGGAVTLASGGTSGDILTIRRDRALTQPAALSAEGRFSPASYEAALDGLLTIDQQQQDQIDRAFQLPVTVDPALVSGRVPVPEAGKALVWNTGASALENRTLDNTTIALPGGGRTTVTLSQYLENNKVFNLADYLPVGANLTAGTTDFTTYINTWYAAIPDGSYGLVPIGWFRFTSKLSWNRQVSIVGMGPGAAFKPDVGAAADGIVVNDTVNASLYRIRLSNFAILNDAVNCCRNALVLNRVHNSDDINVHVKAKATNAGVLFNGCLSNHRVLLQSSVNYSYPYAAAMPVTDTVRLVFDTVNTIACNANDLQVIIEGGANGVYIDDQHGFGNNTIRGVIEGQSSGSYTIYIKNSIGVRICDFHGESNAAYPVTLEDCLQFQLGPNFQLYGQSLNLIGACRAGKLDGVLTNSLTLATTCDRIEVADLVYNIVGTGSISDPGQRLIYTGPVVNAANQSTIAQAGGEVGDKVNLLPNGTFERWNAGDTGVPSGFTFIANSPTYAKTGSGLADTRRNFSRYAAKVTCATTGDATAFALDWNIVANQWVTIFGWVYVATGQPNVTLKTYFNAGAAVRAGAAATTKDGWVYLATSFYCDGVAHSSALGVFMPTTNGTFYLADCGYAVGLTAPRRVWPHPSMVQSELVLDGLGTDVGTAAPASGARRQGDYRRNSAAAVGTPLGWVTTAAGTPGTQVAAPWIQGSSLDNGDANVVLTATSQPTQRFDTTLTAARTVTMPSNATSQNGQKFRIVRTAGGAFTLTVQDAIPATIKVMPSATAAWVDAEYHSSLGWRLTGYGTL